MSVKFSKREARALLWLLPALAVASWLMWEISRTDGWAKARKEDEASSPSVKADGKELPSDIQDAAEHNPDGFSRQRNNNSDQILPSAEADGSARDSLSRALAQLFTFDPNTVEFHELTRLGFTRGEALGIIKYRERGKVFEIPEDFAACYQVSEEIYLRLKPYIRIGEEYRLKKFKRSGSSGTTISRQSDTSVFVSGVAAGVPTEGGQAGIVQGVQPGPGAEEVRRMRPDHENRPILIDINTADSAALISVRGIGERTVMSIIEYRERLGGFVGVEQLAEVRGVTEQNYERMIEQIYVDPAVIQKIDINFAPAKSLAAHPYIGAGALRKLLKQRQLKGGWRTPEELTEDDIFTAEELTKLGPYLVFKSISNKTPRQNDNHAY